MTRVLIPVAEGSEELEAVTMIDLFRRAEFDVTVAGLAAGPVRASRDTVLVPDARLDEAADRRFDLIALPGGLPGAKRLADNGSLAGMLRRQHDEKRWLAAICAAPLVLARHGLLNGRRATSFPGALDDFEAIDRVEDPVVADGHIVTSRGPGTAMDFALTLIELCAGRQLHDRVETGLQRPAAHRRH